MTLPAHWTEPSSLASVLIPITFRSVILPWELFTPPSEHWCPPPCLIRAPSRSVSRIIQANLIVATLHSEIREVIFFEGVVGKRGRVINECDISLYVWLILSCTRVIDRILTLVCIDLECWVCACGNGDGGGGNDRLHCTQS